MEPTIERLIESQAKVLELARKLQAMLEHNLELLGLGNEILQDEVLWFEPATAPEAYLQQTLMRVLKAVVKPPSF